MVDGCWNAVLGFLGSLLIGDKRGYHGGMVGVSGKYSRHGVGMRSACGRHAVGFQSAFGRLLDGLKSAKGTCILGKMFLYLSKNQQVQR